MLGLLESKEKRNQVQVTVSNRTVLRILILVFLAFIAFAAVRHAMHRFRRNGCRLDRRQHQGLF